MKKKKSDLLLMNNFLDGELFPCVGGVDQVVVLQLEERGVGRCVSLQRVDAATTEQLVIKVSFK